MIALPKVQEHHILYGIVEGKVGGICRRRVEESFSQRHKQLRQTLVVNHQVGHLKQRFVAPQVCVGIEMTLNTQIARAQLPLGKPQECNIAVA